MKVKCTKCGIEKGLDGFYVLAHCKYGVNPRCKECIRTWRHDNREHRIAYMQEWRKENSEKVSDYNSIYYAKNKEANDERVRKWRKENPGKASQIEKRKYIKRQTNKVRTTWKQRYLARPRKANPQIAARVAVRDAIRQGYLKRLPCEKCGDPISEGHHHKGYSVEHWLDVQWLCRKHHMEAEGKQYWNV